MWWLPTQSSCTLSQAASPRSQSGTPRGTCHVRQVCEGQSPYKAGVRGASRHIRQVCEGPVAIYGRCARGQSPYTAGVRGASRHIRQVCEGSPCRSEGNVDGRRRREAAEQRGARRSPRDRPAEADAAERAGVALVRLHLQRVPAITAKGANGRESANWSQLEGVGTEGEGWAQRVGLSERWAQGPGQGQGSGTTAY